MSRSAAIIIEDKKFALMKRVRNDNVYYLFPGGKLEHNETAENACIREIREELGLNITIDKKICNVLFNGSEQHYYIATVVGGVFGTGDGEEYSHGYDPDRGTYEPVWINVEDAKCLPVTPGCVLDQALDYISGKWDGSIKTFKDTGDGKYLPVI